MGQREQSKARKAWPEKRFFNILNYLWLATPLVTRKRSDAAGTARIST